MSLSADLESMFDLSPVSLWLEDYSALKDLFDEWRAAGVTDLAAHLAADPVRIRDCMARFKVLRVNQHTLTLFGAQSQEDLLASLDQVFRDDMADCVMHELEQLWLGALSVENQGVNYTLDGRRLDVQVRLRILPGHESKWDRVLVSLADITARVAAYRERVEAERYARGLFDH